MKKYSSAGFTLVEMLVVLGIIAMIVAFAMPRMAKSIGKTNITNAVQALKAASAQYESLCATKGAYPTKADQVMPDVPSGYSTPTFGTATCADGAAIKLTATASLPDLCIGKTGGAWIYGNGTLPSGYTVDDIPVPAANLTYKCP